MADTDLSVPSPSHAEVDGWVVESSSHEQPSNEALAASLHDIAADTSDSDEPTGSDSGAEATGTGVGDSAESDARSARARTADSKFRKESASERKGRMQAEFNALTRQRHDEERRLETLRRERQDLEASRRAPAPRAERSPAASAKPTWEAFASEGKTWSEYEDARDEWVAAQSEARTRKAFDDERRSTAEREAQQRRDSEARRHGEAHRSRIAKARSAHADFDDVVQTYDIPAGNVPMLRDLVLYHDQGGEILYHLAANQDRAAVLASLPQDKVLMAGIRESSAPIEMLNHFSDHPEEAERIAKMPTHAAFVALGRLSMQLEGAKNGSPTAAPSVTKAKPPIRPVGGTRGAATEKRAEDLEFGADYIAAMNKADRARGRSLH